MVVPLFEAVSEAAGNFKHVFPHTVSVQKECTKPICIPHGVFLPLHKWNKTAIKNHVDTGSKKLLFLADKFTLVMNLTNKVSFKCLVYCIKKDQDSVTEGISSVRFTKMQLPHWDIEKLSALI